MNKLKFLRQERGLSQFELAFASNVPRYVIQLAESATRLPNQEEQQKLAAALGVDEQILFPVVRNQGGCHE